MEPNTTTTNPRTETKRHTKTISTDDLIQLNELENQVQKLEQQTAELRKTKK